MRELVVGRRGDHGPRAERLHDRERRRRDAAADAPDQHPLVGPERGLRHEHPPGRLEDERERGRLLERERVRNRVDVLLRHRDQLGVRAVPVLADDRDPVAVLEARVDHDALAGVDTNARAVGSEDVRLRHRRQAFANPDVEVIQRRGAEIDQHLPALRHGIRRILVAENLRSSVVVYTDGLHHVTLSGVTTRELERLGSEVGLDVIGAARAEPYAETERHIRERRARGLFADMRFTMAQPEVSCHPEELLPEAHTVVSAALCYYADEPPRPLGHGRLPRYTWYDAYAELRDKLDELGSRLGGDYRVLVDENQHVDREAAARAGVGFYGKNTMLITRRFGSWVVLGTVVTDQEVETTPRLELDCGSCTLCI